MTTSLHPTPRHGRRRILLAMLITLSTGSIVHAQVPAQAPAALAQAPLQLPSGTAGPSGSSAAWPDAGTARSDAADTARILELAERVARGATAVDPAALAQRYAATAPAPPASPGLRLQVFVSFSMPVASLTKLARQAARLNVPLLLRGMADDSLTSTTRRVAAIANMVPGARFDIDPEAFRRAGIHQVPAFAIVGNAGQCGERACQAPPTGMVLTGDVTLDYALDRLARSEPTIADFARAQAALLKETR